MKNWLSHSNNKLFIAASLLLMISVYLQADFTTDYQVQSWFYNSYDKTWMINDHAPEIKFFFYTFPKILLIGCSVYLIFTHARSNNPLKLKNIFNFLICMIFIPAIISTLKASTNVHCPYDLAAFTGHVPFRSLLRFDSYSAFLAKYDNGNCFPGGHASGGYAFMSSFFVLPNKYKKLGVLTGFALGTYMALFQMMKGAHFLSHSLFTLSFAILLILIVRKTMYRSTEVKP